MLSRPTANWIAGTLELASKVRYGLTSRGVPLFRFIPYDKSFPPMAVGSTSRNLMYHVQAIVEPSEGTTGSLQKGNLIQSNISEQDVLMATYAFDSQKILRKEFEGYEVKTPYSIPPGETRHSVTEGFTFHIDPLNCLDVDDAFTVICHANGEATLWIHIADVDAWIPADTPLDLQARLRATSFYTPNGDAIMPMLPRALSEGAASLAAGDKHMRPALSLRLTWTGSCIQNVSWHLTLVNCMQRFTYESVQETTKTNEIQTLYAIAKYLGAKHDSHDIVAKLMIFYNTEVGKLLKAAGIGLLRRHPLPKQEKLTALQEFLTTFPNLQNFLFQAAEYCLPSDSNTFHAGLGIDAYAYASSPLRRYADLLNQRALKTVLGFRHEPKPTEVNLVQELNRREKQSKAFQRDWFFSSALTATEKPFTKGLVLSEPNAKGKVDVYVDAWKRTVKVRELVPTLRRGDSVTITWYEDRTQPRWKERIVFTPTKTDATSSATNSCADSKVC